MTKQDINSFILEKLSPTTIRCKRCGKPILRNLEQETKGKPYWCPTHKELYEVETLESYIQKSKEEKEMLLLEIKKLML